MKKLFLILIAVAALMVACSLNTSDGAKNDGGTGPEYDTPVETVPGSIPGTPTDTPTYTTPSITDVCLDYSCFVGCNGIDLYLCNIDNQYYSNETGVFAVSNMEVFLGVYGPICGDGGPCTTQPAVTPSYGGGGNSYCSQMGCGGIFCSGDCVGCPGC